MPALDQLQLQQQQSSYKHKDRKEKRKRMDYDEPESEPGETPVLTSPVPPSNQEQPAFDDSTISPMEDPFLACVDPFCARLCH